MSDHETLTEADADADALVDKVRNAEPALTDEQVSRIEADFHHIGITRRVALASLTLPGSDLVEAIEGDRETAVEFARVADCAELHIEKLRAAASLIETFKARVDIALCLREDYEDVLAEVAAEHTRESELRGGGV